MSNDDAKSLIDRYKRMTGKGTPSEYMAYMLARKQVGEKLSAGQRGFLAAAHKVSGLGDPPAITASVPPPFVKLDNDYVPEWITEIDEAIRDD